MTLMSLFAWSKKKKKKRKTEKKNQKFGKKIGYKKKKKKNFKGYVAFFSPGFTRVFHLIFFFL